MFWFDLDNSPHVPLFRPILDELRLRGLEYHITARDFAQTKSLLELWSIPHTLIGRHGGKSKIRKVSNLLSRTSQLVRHARNRRIHFAVSHGSRTQVLASRFLSIPSVVMLDYEYTESRIFNIFSKYLLMPELIPQKRLEQAGFNIGKIVRYPGFKEEIYLQNFVPHKGLRQGLGIREGSVLATIRPPSIVGNYHDPKSEKVFVKTVEYLSSHNNVCCVIASRIASDIALIPEWILRKENVLVLNKAVDGLQLLWNSDVVISGGGTMNREAALLGIPTFSIFSGQKPFLDEYLEEQGKITFIQDENQVNRIPVTQRTIPELYKPGNGNLVRTVTDIITNLARKS